MTTVEPERSAAPVIVVGVDDAEPTASADLRVAVVEARRRGARIRVVHGCAALSPAGIIGADVTDERLHYGEYLLTRAAAVVHRLSDGQVPVSRVNSRELGADALLAESAGAALLILLRHRSPRGGSASASTTGVVAARARCPVLVLDPDETDGRGKAVVVAIGDLGGSGALLRLAAAEAVRRNLPLTVVHPWQLPPEGWGGQRELSRAVTDAVAEDIAREELTVAALAVAADFPTLTLHSRLLRGPAVDVLVAASEGAVVLVVTRPEPLTTEPARGGAFEDVLTRIRCPLLVMPGGSVTSMSAAVRVPSAKLPARTRP